MEAEVARFQRRAARVRKSQLVFIDETPFKSNETPCTALAPAGVTPRVSVDTEIGGKRYDVIDSCTGTAMGPIAIITPVDRQRQGVRGLGARHIVDFVKDDLAPWLEEQSEDHFIICCDGSKAHSERQITAALAEALPDITTEFWRLPPYTGKFINPLDNNLHSVVRNHFQRNIAATRRRPADMKKVIKGAYGSITSTHVRSAYRLCGLFRRH